MPSPLSRQCGRQAREFSTSLARMLDMLDRCQIARDTVTLVLDKGSAALANTVELQAAGVELDLSPALESSSLCFP